MTLEQHKLNIYGGQARAWEAVYDQLVKGNPKMTEEPGTGIQVAIREIKRLQACEADLKGLVARIQDNLNIVSGSL